MRSSPPTSCWAGPDRRPAPSLARSASPRSWSRIPMRAATNAQRRVAGRQGAARHDRRRGARRGSAGRRAARCCDDERRAAMAEAAARASDGPTPHGELADELLAWPSAPRCRMTGEVVRAAPGARPARCAGPRRVGSRCSPTCPWRRYTTLRVGGPADRLAVPRSGRLLAALPDRVRGGRAASSCSATGATSSSPTPGSGASSSGTAPRGDRRADRRVGGDAGAPMALLVNRCDRARGCRARLRDQHPGHARRSGVGQRRGAWRGDRGRPGRGDGLGSDHGRSRRARRGRLRLRLPRVAFQARGAR